MNAAAGALPIVCREERLIGMITDRDILVHGVAAGREPHSTKVKEVVTVDIEYCFEDEEADRGEYGPVAGQKAAGRGRKQTARRHPIAPPRRLAPPTR